MPGLVVIWLPLLVAWLVHHVMFLRTDKGWRHRLELILPIWFSCLGVFLWAGLVFVIILVGIHGPHDFAGKMDVYWITGGGVSAVAAIIILDCAFKHHWQAS